MHLYHLLLRDPRMPLRELAERMGISLQAVHKRMQALLEAGILVGTGAAIPGNYLNATSVFIFGRMEGEASASGGRRAGQERFCRVRDALLGERDVRFRSPPQIGGNGPVPGIRTKDLFNEGCHNGNRFARSGRRGQASRTPRTGGSKLSPLDLRIIASLKDDARKPYAQVGEEIGATARTVRLRLDRMIEEGSVELILKVNPTFARTINSVVHVFTREGVDRNIMGIELMKRFPASVLFFRSYCNIPDMISVATNHRMMSSLFETMNILYEDKRVTKVIPNIVITAWEFDTWREKILLCPRK